MPLAQTRLYTEADYYNLPEDVRAELIDGNLIYNQAALSRIRQSILGELYTAINNYLKAKGVPAVYIPPRSLSGRWQIDGP